MDMKNARKDNGKNKQGNGKCNKLKQKLKWVPKKVEAANKIH